MSKVALLNTTSYMPYNLMYLAAYLRKHGIESRIFDEIKKLYDYNPDIVGISDMFTESHRFTLNLCQEIKTKMPKARIVVGGNHISSFPKIEKGIDQIVIGEGEEAFLEICRGETEKIIRKKFLDIDEIPMPAYDLVDVEKYIQKGNPFSMRRRTMGIVSSRGCPNACKYCSIGAVWGRTWRGRNSTSVREEIIFLRDKYNVHEFSFFDDSMSINSARLKNICYKLKGLGIKWTTPNGIAHWTLDKKLIKLMHDSGCYRITFGIESGSPEIRRYIGKDYDLKQAAELIRYANRIGMWTNITNIIGLPYERDSDIQDTIEFAIRSDADFACFYKLIPHPGSAIARDMGHVKFSDEDLNKLQRQAYRRLLINRSVKFPSKIIKKIHSMEDLRYVFRLFRLGIKILFNTFRKKGHILYG